ncbi:MAG: cytochrome P450 [Halioglobus sp.]|nr:cytochrome P450 [Halioglobus sp.]
MTTIFDYTIPDHIPEELIFPLDGESHPELMKNPFAVFADLHKEAPPIFFNPAAFQGAGGWSISDGAIIKEVLQNPELFSSKNGTGFSFLLGQELDLIPLEIDPPEHMKYRIHFNKPLSPRSIAPREESVRSTAISLLEKFQSSGQCEFVEDFAIQFPVRIFMELFGMPPEDFDRILDYENKLLHVSNTIETRSQAARDIYDYLVDLLAAKRANPGDDLASAVLGFTVDERDLTDKEILGMYFLLFVGGLDTVASSLGFAWRYLAANPQAQQQLRDNSDLIPGAIEEFFRLHSVVEVRRSVTQDVEFHGVQLKQGDFVNCITAVASLDSKEFENPMEADFERSPNRHCAFVFGPHRCMGSNLARLEMRVALEEWLNRVPEFSIEEGAEIDVNLGAVVSLARLPLVW